MGEKSNVKLKIIATYRPPSTDPRSFIEDLYKGISVNVKCDLEFLIGDINIEINDKNCNRIIQEYLNSLCALSYYPQINISSRVTEISSSC